MGAYRLEGLLYKLQGVLSDTSLFIFTSKTTFFSYYVFKYSNLININKFTRLYYSFSKNWTTTWSSIRLLELNNHPRGNHAIKQSYHFSFHVIQTHKVTTCNVQNVIKPIITSYSSIFCCICIIRRVTITSISLK
jgi:hypothetical protein